MIVDDELIAIESRLRISFKTHGVDLAMAADCAGAIEKMKGAQFDLIIIDITLAGNDNGIDLVKKIRETDKQTRIYVLTGYDEIYKDAAYAAGADWYINKPLDAKKHVYKPLGVADE